MCDFQVIVSLHLWQVWDKVIWEQSLVNDFASAGGDESTTLEQRMLKQHTSQRTVEKRTVTMTTHSQLKSYRLNES